MHGFWIQLVFTSRFFAVIDLHIFSILLPGVQLCDKNRRGYDAIRNLYPLDDDRHGRSSTGTEGSTPNLLVSFHKLIVRCDDQSQSGASNRMS